MQIEELKQLIKSSSSVVIMESGEPAFVVMDYDSYRSLISDRMSEKEIKVRNIVTGRNKEFSAHSGNGTQNQISQPGGGNNREAEIIERLNKDILALKAQIEMEEKGLSSHGID